MSQSKDPAIKLFGRKIPLPDTQIPADLKYKDGGSEVTKVETDLPSEANSEEPDKAPASGLVKEENQTPIQVNEVQVTSMPKECLVETSSTDQEKVFKKPDRVLPCPRCNSLDTKFCYFNNYNVNQPRHFCKNCQRYWTAGGTMRNVPVGAGRRKNKHLACQHLQMLVSSDGMPISRVENSDASNNQVLSSVESASTLTPSTGNGMVLKFGPEAPLCESMETVLNLRDQSRNVEMSSFGCRENGEEPSSYGSSMASSSVPGSELPENFIRKEQAGLPGSSNEPSAPQPVHCYPVSPWVYPCNPGGNNGGSMRTTQYSTGQACVPNGVNPNHIQWCPTPMLAVPSFCPPSIPLQFVPASYWGCMPMWSGGTGNISLCGSNGCLSPLSSSSTSCCSGNSSSTLGKHSRDSKCMDEEKVEQCVLVPKTLRIDDPSEALKSLLSAKVGLITHQKDLMSKGTIFKTFETKAEGKGNGYVSEANDVLEANPAALSRSHTFQESS